MRQDEPTRSIVVGHTVIRLPAWRPSGATARFARTVLRRRKAVNKQINRRELLRSMAGSPVMAALGAGGLLTLLADRQAVAAGTAIPIVGVTSEVGDRGTMAGEAHRHTFGAIFTLKRINPNNGDITGDIIGQTQQVLSTGDEPEDFHVHFIRMQNVLISQTIPTFVADQHAHQLHVD
jgi:hypothetical protein